MTNLRKAAQQALEALERTDAEPGTLAWERENEAMEALRAALAEQKCPCGDRPADQCPGEWEPGCDLGANEKHVKVMKVAEQAQPVQPPYWGVFEGGNLHDFFTVRETAEEMAYYKGSHAVVGPIYTTPPAPVVPQPLSGLDVERLLEDVVGSLPVARKLIRAVEAAVLERMGVQR